MKVKADLISMRSVMMTGRERDSRRQVWARHSYSRAGAEMGSWTMSGGEEKTGEDQKGLLMSQGSLGWHSHPYIPLNECERYRQ